MTPSQIWQAFLAIHPQAGAEPEAFAFGAEADRLAQLVLQGTKTATASAYDEYLHADEPTAQVGDYAIVLDSQGQAICIIQTTKVSIEAFNKVSSDHAWKEGEHGYESHPALSPADLNSLKEKSLAAWRQVHQDLFTQWLAAIGIDFTEDSRIVLEEFCCVYPSPR